MKSLLFVYATVIRLLADCWIAHDNRIRLVVSRINNRHEAASPLLGTFPPFAACW